MKDKIENVIKEAGKIMLRARDKDFLVEEKGTANFVTEYDIKVQRFLESEFIKIIPDASFLAEEEGEDKNGVGDGYTFIIDPIDGTSNFTFGVNMSVISVALTKDKETVFGAVYNPYTDEYFHAEKGKGAYLNGKAIKVSSAKPKDALVALGTAPYYKKTVGKEVKRLFTALLENFGDLRRSGTAAMDLCNVARGSFVAFFEPLLSPWDYAAGALIVKEAGGVITDFSGNELDSFKKSSVLATSDKVYDLSLKLVEEN